VIYGNKPKFIYKLPSINYTTIESTEIISEDNAIEKYISQIQQIQLEVQ
jgi:hypothetical protein